MSDMTKTLFHPGWTLSVALAPALIVLVPLACSGAGFSGAAPSATADAGDAALADGSDPPDTGAASADPFVGTWSCTAMDTTTYTAPLDTPTTTMATASAVVISDDGAGLITALRTPEDAAPPCTLKSHLNPDGVSSTLIPGQACTTANGGTATYSSGTATMSGSSAYTTQSNWDYAGHTAKGAVLTGVGTGSGSCTRM
jgi:hypothetical protein